MREKLPCNSPFEKTKLRFISSDILKLLAVLFMLCDHVWATVMTLPDYLTYIGRVAFPIFAFLIAEGFLHTKNVRKYMLRLLLFAVISEIPFNLFYSSRVFNPFHQNVMFTLLLGLCAISLIAKMKSKKTFKNIFLSSLLLLLIALLSVITFPDYGFYGMLMVVMFYVLRDFPFAFLAQLVAMVLINIVLFEGQVFMFSVFSHHVEIPVQGFAVLSLIPIWFYNGKKAKTGRILQYGFYAFYPLHMLILYFIRYFA